MSAPDEAQRLRAFLLDMLRLELQSSVFYKGELIAVLSPVPAEEAWVDHLEVTDPKPDGWYLWRDPNDPTERVHADRVIVEAGKIAGKWGCGLLFYTECAPLDLPADVAQLIAEQEARKAATQ